MSPCPQGARRVSVAKGLFASSEMLHFVQHDNYIFWLRQAQRSNARTLSLSKGEPTHRVPCGQQPVLLRVECGEHQFTADLLGLVGIVLFQHQCQRQGRTRPGIDGGADVPGDGVTVIRLRLTDGIPNR